MTEYSDCSCLNGVQRCCPYKLTTRAQHNFAGMGDRLATIGMGRSLYGCRLACVPSVNHKSGGSAVPLSVDGELGSI